MSFKTMISTLMISAFVSLGVAAVANAATIHADTCTVTVGSACPNDGGAGNG